MSKNSSWKQYSGNNTSDKLNSLYVSNLVVDNITIRNNLSVDNFYAYGNLFVKQNVDISGSLTINYGNVYVSQNIDLSKNLFVGENVYLKKKLYFGTTTQDISRKYAFFYGDSINGNFGICANNNSITNNNLAVFDICANVPNVLSLRTNQNSIRNVIAQNVANHGITSETDLNSASINFFYGTNTVSGDGSRSSTIFSNSNNNLVLNAGNIIIDSSLCTIIDSSINTIVQSDNTTHIYSASGTFINSSNFTEINASDYARVVWRCPNVRHMTRYLMNPPLFMTYRLLHIC